MKKRFIFLAGIIALVLSFLFDKQIALAMLSLRNFVLNNFMVGFANFTVELLIAGVIVLLFILSKERRKWSFHFVLSSLIALIITIALKFLVGRVRPFVALNLELIRNVNYNFPVWNTSFPSLHAAVAFAALPFLIKKFPRVKWFWIGFVCFVSFTRLYIGVHYLSDVVAGALIGLIVGLAILEKINL